MNGLWEFGLSKIWLFVHVPILPTGGGFGYDRTMKKCAFRVFVGLFGVLACGSAFGASPTDSKKVAVCGNAYATEEFEKLVLEPAGLDGESFVGSVVAASDLSKYRAVVFAERDESAIREGSAWTEESLQKLEQYVNSGGVLIFCRYGISTVILTRALGVYAGLFGFRSYPDAKVPTNVELTPAGRELLTSKKGKTASKEELNWVVGATPIAEGVTTAKVLASVETEGGSASLITVNESGKGRVYFMGVSLNALQRNQAPPEPVEGLAALLRAALGDK